LRSFSCWVSANLLGKSALGSFNLGAVTGTLLAGVVVGQLGITLPDEVKQCFFLLFLFAIGFRTGPGGSWRCSKRCLR
jgi:putative transport protein